MTLRWARGWWTHVPIDPEGGLVGGGVPALRFEPESLINERVMPTPTKRPDNDDGWQGPVSGGGIGYREQAGRSSVLSSDGFDYVKREGQG